MILLTLLLSVSSLAQTAAGQPQLITGVADVVGTIPGDCSFAPPAPALSEADADAQAAELCRAGGQHTVRTTGFSHSSNNCVWGGPQYKYARDTDYAQAVYRCED